MKWIWKLMELFPLALCVCTCASQLFAARRRIRHPLLMAWAGEERQMMGLGIIRYRKRWIIIRIVQLNFALCCNNTMGIWHHNFNCIYGFCSISYSWGSLGSRRAFHKRPDQLVCWAGIMDSVLVKAGYSTKMPHSPSSSSVCSPLWAKGIIMSVSWFSGVSSTFCFSTDSSELTSSTAQRQCLNYKCSGFCQSLLSSQYENWLWCFTSEPQNRVAM